jgi:hypothetical protein
MKRLIPLVIIVVATCLSSAALAGGSRNGGRLARCPPRHTEIIKANREAAIYEDHNLNYEGSSEWFGCAYRTKRAYLLGVGEAQFSSSGGGGIELPQLVGAVIAYGLSSTEPTEPPVEPGEPPVFGKSSWLVVVRNLRTGRVLHKVPTGPSSSRSVGAGPVGALVVKSDGAVAWVTGADNAQSPHEIHAIDRKGSRLLATGLGIYPLSLRLKGSTISWTQNGQSFSAPLS